MVYAIIHRVSQQVIEKHEANSDDECRSKYLANHPELECDTVNEMMDRYPVLMQNLWQIPLN